MPPSIRISTSGPKAWGASARMALDQVAGLQGAGVERRLGDPRPGRRRGSGRRRAAGVRVPPRRAEARERRRQDHAMLGLGAAGELLDRLGTALDAQLDVDPLDRRPRHEDRALKGIGHAPLDPRGDRASRRERDTGRASPVFSSMKQPVP